jgi:signal transduction histidine kinase/ActR/RegA family two-component response regulator
MQQNDQTQHIINSLLCLSLEDIPFNELLRRSFSLILSFPWSSFEQKGRLFIVEDAPDVLVMKVQENLDHSMQEMCAQVPFGKCLCGRAALTREIQYIDCFNDFHGNIYYEDVDPLGHYCIPILSPGKVHGVINMYLKKGHHPGQNEVIFLTAITNILSLGIERKRAEEGEAKIRTQFLHAQKMEALGLLAGGVAHDFNNVITTIRGYSDLSLMELPTDSALYQNIAEIRKASVLAADLTRQLLLFSRRQPSNFLPVNLNEVIRNMLRMLHRLIGENFLIIAEFSSDLWTVNADIGLIEQVIMNLLVNARDALPEGGKIVIRTENIWIDEHYFKTYGYGRPGKFVCFSVKDTGTGMDSTTISRIFEPFFTTKGPGKGTGLGLPVVNGIIKQHEGWIQVESQPGQGSIFRIYLPDACLKPEEEKREWISIQRLHGKGEKVLLVEDEEAVRSFAERMLRQNGYAVFTAASAEEALDIFIREGGKLDLVFNDMVLPDKSGLNLVNRLLEIKPDLKVFFASGYSDERTCYPLLKKKGYRFLQKPYAMIDLLRGIRELLQES